MWPSLVICSLLAASASPAIANQTPALGKKPQMGWNSYNAYKLLINETVIHTAADLLVEKGFLAAGYNYLNLDDGWADNRDTSGSQQGNITRFPQGIAALAKYVHSRGLKFGLYSDAGILGCGFRPGSYGYEERDAETFAEWGVDYLKYDNCGGFQANTLPVQERFLRMGDALRRTGREILYSLCEWGHQFPWLWADEFSHSYRMSGDIHAEFSQDNKAICKTAYCLDNGYAGVSVLTMIRKMRELSPFQSPGSWADMDLLEIGNNAMTELEEQTQMSFWAALKTPLIISADLARMNDSSHKILTNRDIIAISQDDLGVAVDYVPALSSEGKTQIWAGPLSSGHSKFVILAFNEANSTQSISVPLDQIPRLSDSKATYRSGSQVWDLWKDKKIRLSSNNLTLSDVRSHETKVIVFS